MSVKTSQSTVNGTGGRVLVEIATGRQRSTPVGGGL